MSNLTPFSIIDPYDREASWAPGKIEAAIFLQKMDCEGGIDGLLNYGGWQEFPDELQVDAEVAQKAMEKLEEAVVRWAAERGVEY